MISRTHVPSSFSFCCPVYEATIALDIRFKFKGKSGVEMIHQYPSFCSREQKLSPTPWMTSVCWLKLYLVTPDSKEIGKESSLMELGILVLQTKLRFCHPGRWRPWLLGRWLSVSAVASMEHWATGLSQGLSAYSGVL